MKSRGVGIAEAIPTPFGHDSHGMDPVESFRALNVYSTVGYDVTIYYAWEKECTF